VTLDTRLVVYLGLPVSGEHGHERRYRRVELYPRGQRVGVGPVKVTQGDAVEGDLRIVLGGLKLAGGLVERWAAALGLWIDHLAPSRIFFFLARA
jgi:hypothetical protein